MLVYAAKYAEKLREYRTFKDLEIQRFSRTVPVFKDFQGLEFREKI